MTSSRLPAGGSSPRSRSTPSERIADAGLALRRAIDRHVHATQALADAAGDLSASYRADGSSALDDRRAAEGYAAARMPATFAACARAIAAAAERTPGFQPGRLLDLGPARARLLGRERGLADDWTHRRSSIRSRARSLSADGWRAGSQTSWRSHGHVAGEPDFRTGRCRRRRVRPRRAGSASRATS